MKAVAYIRVSSKDQDENIQFNALKEYADRHGIKVVKYYVDKGVSGGKMFKHREDAKKLLDELDNIKPDLILAWSIDRIGRTMLDTLNTIIELEKQGYKVVTVKEEWLQTMDPNMRKLILSILSWVAEFERRRIRERQEEAWKQGKQKGRPPAMTSDQVRKYVVKYKELAKHNKKALWMIVKADGHRISYPRFLEKVNRVLKDLGWW